MAPIQPRTANVREARGSPAGERTGERVAPLRAGDAGRCSGVVTVAMSVATQAEGHGSGSVEVTHVHGLWPLDFHEGTEAARHPSASSSPGDLRISRDQTGNHHARSRAEGKSRLDRWYARSSRRGNLLFARVKGSFHTWQGRASRQ